jgi:threonine dehydratase
MSISSEQRDRRLAANGWRWLLIGGIIFVPALVIMLIGGDSLLGGVGVALAAFSTLATVVGIGLHVSAAIERRSRAGKPFA